MARKPADQAPEDNPQETPAESPKSPENDPHATYRRELPNGLVIYQF